MVIVYSATRRAPVHRHQRCTEYQDEEVAVGRCASRLSAPCHDSMILVGVFTILLFCVPKDVSANMENVTKFDLYVLGARKAEG